MPDIPHNIIKAFFWFQFRFSNFQSTHYLLSCHQTLLRKPTMLLLHFFPIRYLYILTSSPWAFPSPGSITPVISVSLHMRDAPALHHFCGLSLDSLRYVHISFILDSPDQDTALQTWLYQCLEEGKALLAWPPGSIPPNAAQEALSKFFKSTYRNSIYFNSLKAKKKKTNTHSETIATKKRSAEKPSAWKYF